MVSGQSDYIPLINKDLKWDIKDYTQGHICRYSENSSGRYFLGEDTLIDSKRYYKVMVNFFIPKIAGFNCPPFTVDTVAHHYFNYYLREDIDEQKVFLYNETNYQPEQLIFDFSVDIGDTVETGVIDSIINWKFEDGITRRIFFQNNFLSNTYFDEYYFGFDAYVEGLGGPRGFFIPPYAPFEDGKYTICILNAGVSVTSYCEYVISSTVNSFQFEFNIYPNPTDADLYIQTDISAPLDVIFYNTNGKILLIKSLEMNASSLNLSILPQGVYWLKFISGNKLMGVNRILKI